MFAAKCRTRPVPGVLRFEETRFSEPIERPVEPLAEILWREKSRKTAGFSTGLRVEVRDGFGLLAEEDGFELAVRTNAARSPHPVIFKLELAGKNPSDISLMS